MKTFLGINWKVRSKNPNFWVKIALSIIGIPIAYAGTEYSEINTWGTFFGIIGNAYANPYIVAMILFALYNSISEDTSKGFGDLSATKQMLKPFTDKDPNNVFGLIRQNNEIDRSESSHKETENGEIVDGINGKEISDGDMKDELEQQEETAEDTFSTIDNMVFGDKAEPQDVGNDDEDRLKEKRADAEIKGEEIKG